MRRIADERAAGDDGRVLAVLGPQRERLLERGRGEPLRPLDDGERLLVQRPREGSRRSRRRVIRSNIQRCCARRPLEVAAPLAHPVRTATSTFTSRNESESAAWRTSASWSPPTSCATNQPLAPRAIVASAAPSLAQPLADDPGRALRMRPPVRHVASGRHRTGRATGPAGEVALHVVRERGEPERFARVRLEHAAASRACDGGARAFQYGSIHRVRASSRHSVVTGRRLEQVERAVRDRPLDVLRRAEVAPARCAAERRELRSSSARRARRRARDARVFTSPLRSSDVVVRASPRRRRPARRARSTASTSIRSRRRCTGSTVKSTPDFSGVDHPLHDDRHPEIVERSLARAVEERALAEERRPALDDASQTSSAPSTFRYVSCWPAKLAASESSAHADERTATRPAQPLVGRGDLASRRLGCARRAPARPPWSPARASARSRLGVDGTPRARRRGRRSPAARAARRPPSPRGSRPCRRRTRTSTAALVVEPDDRPAQSSRIATARTGAAVVPIHLTGKTESLKPCDGSWSRFMRFSRCQ